MNSLLAQNRGFDIFFKGDSVANIVVSLKVHLYEIFCLSGLAKTNIHLGS
jgi:hypothetical protein